MDFNFWLKGSGNNWRLSPFVPRFALRKHEEEWGNIYNADRPEMNRSRFFRESVGLALTTDLHTWNEDIKPFNFPYLVSTFRGSDGQTELEIHFELPIGLFSQKAGEAITTLEIELGCALHNLAWQEIDKSLVTQQVQPTADPAAEVLGSCHFTAPPASYHVALHSRPLGTSLLGGYRFDYRLPNYSAPRLAMSDVLPAFSVRAATRPSRFDRGDLHVRPNPSLRFSVEQPVHLYYEIYYLTLDAEDQTHYSIEYTFVQQKQKVLGVLDRKGGTALTVRTERRGDEVSPVEVVELDVRAVKPGRYTLTVKVTDERTGVVVERSRQIELTD